MWFFPIAALGGRSFRVFGKWIGTDEELTEHHGGGCPNCWCEQEP